MARLAAIDVGTNSVKMTIADTGNGMSIVREVSKTTRLGKGVDATKSLSREAMDATLHAFGEFKKIADELGVERMAIVGTSALRDAVNGAEFVSAVRELTGIDLEIISGNREAQLAYRAVQSDPSLALPVDTDLAVFDIGGGSSEINFGRGAHLTSHESLNIGAVRLTERFLASDPPASSEIAEARQQAEGMFASIDRPSGAITVCGIGGTAVNTAAIHSGGGNVHGALLTAEAVDSILERLASVALAERRTIPGLEPARADVIVGGAIILSALLNKLNAAEMRVSTRGLRFGLLADMGAVD